MEHFDMRMEHHNFVLKNRRDEETMMAHVKANIATFDVCNILHIIENCSPNVYLYVLHNYVGDFVFIHDDYERYYDIDCFVICSYQKYIIDENCCKTFIKTSQLELMVKEMPNFFYRVKNVMLYRGATFIELSVPDEVTFWNLLLK